MHEKTPTLREQQRAAFRRLTYREEPNASSDPYEDVLVLAPLLPTYVTDTSYSVWPRYELEAFRTRAAWLDIDDGGPEAVLIAELLHALAGGGRVHD